MRIELERAKLRFQSPPSTFSQITNIQASESPNVSTIDHAATMKNAYATNQSGFAQSYDKRWTMTGRKSVGDFTLKALHTNDHDEHVVSNFDTTMEKTPVKGLLTYQTNTMSSPNLDKFLWYSTNKIKDTAILNEKENTSSFYDSKKNKSVKRSAKREINNSLEELIEEDNIGKNSTYIE